MAPATKKTSDVTSLADLFDSLVGRAADPEVQNLFELIGIPDSVVDAHQQRLANVAHNKALARKLPTFQMPTSKPGQSRNVPSCESCNRNPHC